MNSKFLMLPDMPLSSSAISFIQFKAAAAAAQVWLLVDFLRKSNRLVNALHALQQCVAEIDTCGNFAKCRNSK